MYIPAYNRVTDLSRILSFMRDHSFAIISTSGDGVPLATHIPVEVGNEEGKIILHGHVSRANLQWKDFEKHKRALVIFSGPHAYVSSRWYNHPNAPTWNYIAVHAEGVINILDDNEMRDSLSGLLAHHEAGVENAVTMESLPANMVNKYLKGITGFRINVDKLEGKWKMSQNRNDQDFQNIIRELELINDINSKMVAAEMKKISGTM